MQRKDAAFGEVTLRADAEMNRDRIIEAARHLYATEGLTISMAAVARHANVGKATLTRRFPTRDHLIAAVFVEQMAAYVQATKDALLDSDPWLGFIGFIEEVCGMQAADRGFADVLTITFPGAKDLDALRASSYQGFLTLIENARATGHLRMDFVSEDFVIFLMANAGVITATAAAAQGSWCRLVGHFLRAISNPGAPLPAISSAPTSDDLYLAMARTT